jgi:predicted RNA binding protein YcfA (HicA-like mRNA interferase family)
MGDSTGPHAYAWRLSLTIRNEGSPWRPKLVRVKVRDAIAKLELNGWRLARQKGSHRQFHHPFKPGTVTVAGHPSEEVPTGTLKNIMKQAGIQK